MTKNQKVGWDKRACERRPTATPKMVGRCSLRSLVPPYGRRRRLAENSKCKIQIRQSQNGRVPIPLIGFDFCILHFDLHFRALASPACAELAGSRPNIVLVVSDDQGYGDLGRHGNPLVSTPNLDRLYDESVRFDDFHVSPTCAPTRASLMTGRHEFKNGVTHTILERERLNLHATTIAQVLKSAGYRTGIFGKWHLGDETPYQPGRRGFDETFIHGAGGIGQTYAGSCGDAPGNRYFDPVILHNGTFEKTHGYCTDVFFGQAMKWIESIRGEAPFFCYVPTNAPHAPLDVPREYEQLYADKDKTAGRPSFWAW